MTTKVTIEACCSPEKYVLVIINDDTTKQNGIEVENIRLSNGEKVERFVYDERSICVSEQLR
jgi:hypothetical protein